MVSRNDSNSDSHSERREQGANSISNSDIKELPVFRQQASAVSQAIWPSNLHRSQVIGKTVQRQRHSANDIYLLWVLQHIPASFPVLLVVTSTIVGGSIVTALLLHVWYVLLLPTLLLALTTLAIVPPFINKLNAAPRQTIQPLPMLQSTPRYFKSSPGLLTAHRTLETPMPKTPLVRELETFDLSETGVEHFLDVNSGSGVRERAANLTDK